MTSPLNNGGPTVKIAIVATVAVSALLSLGAFVWLSLKHLDTGPLVLFVTGVIVPQILSLFTSHGVNQKVDQLQTDMGQVKSQTNGPLKDIAQAVGDIHDATVNPPRN